MIKWIALGALAVMVLLFIFAPTVAWIIIGLILLIILAVLFIPIGADLAFVDGKFTLAARADGFTLQLIPRKQREKKPKEQAEEKPKEPEEQKPKEEEQKDQKGSGFKLDLTVEEIFELIKKVLNGLGKFGKITVRHFMLHYIAAGDDPYKTAMTFNYVNAALSTLAPICARKFNITGDVDVWTDVDFGREWMKLDFALSVTIRIAQFVHMGFAIGFGVLGVLIKNWRRRKREEREAKKAAREEQKNENKEHDDSVVEIDTKIQKNDKG